MQTSIARRYARALFGLAEEDKQLEPIRLGLDQVDQIIRGQAEIQDLCRNPIYSLQQKQQILEALVTRLKAPPLLNQFMFLLAQKNRLPYLPEITKLFDHLVDEAQNIEKIQVKVAKKLSPKQTTDLQKQMEKIMRRRVNLSVEVDPALIGGMEATAGGKIYDGSIRGQLEALRRELLGAQDLART